MQRYTRDAPPPRRWIDAVVDTSFNAMMAGVRGTARRCCPTACARRGARSSSGRCGRTGRAERSREEAAPRRPGRAARAASAGVASLAAHPFWRRGARLQKRAPAKARRCSRVLPSGTPLLAQDRVRRRRVEVDVGHHELEEIVDPGEDLGLAADGTRDLAVLGAVELRGRKRLRPFRARARRARSAPQTSFPCPPTSRARRRRGARTRRA